MVYARYMHCPRCGADTRPGQKFCAECGLALASACPNCGAAYEGSPKFCAECGFALTPRPTEIPSTAPTPSAGTTAPPTERRFVTVLFADLVGFTALAADQDPEEVRDLLSRYFEVARQLIDGYGGAVEKFIGDAVMAVWGAPVAREDDPERAVRAALELVARVREIEFAGASLALRAGVLSGEAAIVPGRTGEGMIAGDLVNTASRLQSVAQPGVVLVGEATYQATSPAIAYEPAGDQALKGKETPVPAWRALRVVARRGGEGRDEALEPPFVGREEELRLLRDQLHAAERERKLRMVAITGQAGIGKTRLIWELEKYLDGLAGATYFWNQGRSPAYGEGISFWALGEMVRRRARIAEGENEATTRTKLHDTLRAFVPDARERHWLEPALGALLGIDQADWVAREELFSAWRTFFERIADQGPTVITFEDLQWADNGLLDFIEHMLEWSRDKPILIVTLARPELLERRPNFGMGHRSLVALHLEPLTDDAMRDLVRGLVPRIADADLARIVERAEGVPLYAVETIRSLVDAGHLVRVGDTYQLSGTLPQLDIPPTLRALISSRLDSLDADDRRLLLDASVIGQVFPLDALVALAGESSDEVARRLHELARKELVTLDTDPRSPERGQYRFTQGLIRDVAFSTLPRRERRARHLAAARYYDTLGDDELAGVVATHYLEAFKAAPEGEEGATIAAQARVALRAAAERAQRLHSNLQAMTYFEQAMAVAFDETELNELRVRAARAAVAAIRYDLAEPHIKAAIAWSEQHDDKERTLGWMATYGAWLLDMSRVDDGVAILKAGVELGPSEDGHAQVYLHGHLGRANLFLSDTEAALQEVDLALAAAERLRYRSPTLQLLITKAWALAGLGRLRESIALLTGAMALADQEGDVGAQTRARFNLSGTILIDDPRRALAIAMEGVDLMNRYGTNPASMAGNAAGAALLIGDLDRVFELETATAEARTTMGAFVYGDAACAAALRGDVEGSLRRMEFVEQMLAQAASAQDLREVAHERAWIAFAEGRLADANRLAREAMELFPSAGSFMASPLAAHAALLMTDLEGVRRELSWLDENAPGAKWLDRSRASLKAGALALEGQTDAAATEYLRLVQEWRDVDLPFDLAMTLLERSIVLNPGDREAAEAREEARRVFATMGAEGLIERLEAGARRDRAGAKAAAMTEADPRASAAPSTR